MKTQTPKETLYISFFFPLQMKPGQKEPLALSMFCFVLFFSRHPNDPHHHPPLNNKKKEKKYTNKSPLRHPVRNVLSKRKPSPAANCANADYCLSIPFSENKGKKEQMKTLSHAIHQTRKTNRNRLGSYKEKTLFCQ